jgi:hypothetical protein
MVSFTGAGGMVQIDNFGSFNPVAIGGFAPGDVFDIVTNSPTASADSITTAFNASTDTLTINVGSISRALQLTGSHTASDFTNAVVGIDTVLASGQTIDLGAGNHQLTLGAAATSERIVVPTLAGGAEPGFLDIINANTTDLLDFTKALSSTTWNGNTATVGSFLQYSTVGTAGVISLSHDGTAAAVPVLKLENGAGIVGQLVAHAVV